MVEREPRLEAALADIDRAVDSPNRLDGHAVRHGEYRQFDDDAKRASEAVDQAVKASGKHAAENQGQLIGLFAD
jgi:hypothetical protein